MRESGGSEVEALASTIVATPGTSSSISLGASCPSDCAIGARVLINETRYNAQFVWFQRPAYRTRFEKRRRYTGPTAVAARNVSRQFVGDWCLDNPGDDKASPTYRLGRCLPHESNGSDSWLTVRADGFVAHETRCSAIINWNTFDIGVNESVRFNQPNSGSIALNRVIGGLGPSEILGHLTANGRIFLINRDGILFGPGAVVNTAGFLASTNDIKNADFMAGRYNFKIVWPYIAS
jgi:filamentous hemagglutinin family protein